MAWVEECEFEQECLKCEFYSKMQDNLEICKKHSTVIFAKSRDLVRRKFQETLSEIKIIRLENQGFLHDLLQKEINGEQLTEREKHCKTLLDQFSSVQSDLWFWLDGCEPTNQDGKNIYQFFNIAEEIKSFFGGEYRV